MRGNKSVLAFICISISCLFITSEASVRVRRVPQLAECATLEDCNNLWRHGEAFQCLEGKCACHPQATFDPSNKDCKCNQGYTRTGNQCSVQPAVPPEARASNGSIVGNPASRSSTGCTSDADCPQNAQCRTTGCECNENYVLISSVCMLAAKTVGDSCQYDEQCTTSLGGRSKCENTRCVCMTAAVPVLDNTKCFEKKDLGNPCTYHEQCSHIQHGTCAGDVCLCDPGFVALDNSCVAVVDKYNGICLDSIQCHNGKLGYGSRCARKETGVDTKTCVCEKEYFYKEESQICLFAKGLGDPCDGKNNDCYLHADGDEQFIECKKSVCTCKKGYKPSEDNKQCENTGVVNHLSYFIMTLSLLIYVTRW